jgi:hypothetical protein
MGSQDKKVSDCPNQRPSPIPEPVRREARQKSLSEIARKQQFVLAHLRRTIRDLLLSLTAIEVHLRSDRMRVDDIVSSSEEKEQGESQEPTH